MPANAEAGTILLRAVHATAPRREAPLLHDINLHVEAGEQLIVLGPSGAGKSSLLRVICGIIPHSVATTLTGSVAVGGVETADTTVVERSRLVGVLAQDPAASVCLAHVDHEIALPLENAGVTRDAIDTRIVEALAVVGATALRHRDTSTLSGGETQRVALAATIAVRPPVLLLDEPTSMLDPAGVAAVRSAIESAVAEYAPTVVLVEHRLDEFAGASGVAGLPSRALVLDESGAIVADGPTREVLATHASRLHAAGCWLPLESELQALTAMPDGLAHAANQRFLEQLAEAAPPVAPPVAPRSTSGELLLTATALSVSRASGAGGARRSRAAGSPRRGFFRRARSTPALVLDAISVQLVGGEVVALLGRNGVGKSSLLLSLAGLLPPQSGALSGTRPGLVFQNPEAQFLAHRVRDEIAVGLSGSATDVDALVRRQLATHRLEHLAEQSPYRLSGGEQRRLSLAAMLAHHDRPLLLADEPTFGLDRRDTIATSNVFRDQARQGRGILFSSHDLRLVATIADRVIVLGQPADVPPIAARPPGAMPSDATQGAPTQAAPSHATRTAAPAEILADGPTIAVLRDASLLQAAGLELPALLKHLLHTIPTHRDHAVQHTLRALDEAVASAQLASIEVAAA